MFSLTHIYCAEKIKPDANNMFLYGSIFPDIPVTGIVDWEVMKNKTIDFGNDADKYVELDGFSAGLFVHEEPWGIDRFVHGENGYAYSRGKVIHKQLEQYFPEETIATVAHGFIEFSIEQRLVKKIPKLQGKMSDIINSIEGKEELLSNVFGNLFNIQVDKAFSAIKNYNVLLSYDISTRDKALSLYTRHLSTYRSVTLDKNIVSSLLDICENETRDYLDFLGEIIEKCKKDTI